MEKFSYGNITSAKIIQNKQFFFENEFILERKSRKICEWLADYSQEAKFSKWLENYLRK